MPRRKLLYIAYHFPPIQGSTGAIRTVAFSNYLRQYQWEVRVLTIQAKAYEDTAIENALLIPSHIHVDRAWGFDARRTLSIMGRYPLFLALPDRWQSWIIGGFIKGCRIVRSWSPDAIMTTYPIASAHMIGYLLRRKFRLPWIAEFRDPMLQANYPSNQLERRTFATVEQLIFANAQEIVVTTDGCRKMYLNRYPSWNETNISCISNGYDPRSFARVAPPATFRDKTSDTLILLHSGLLYPDARNPAAFFSAIRTLKQAGYFETIKVEFRLRASGTDAQYQTIAQKLGIDSHVRILPRIPYAEAVQEMMQADALMLFQAETCNNQIPAKAYEYMYCRKPILAFTDPAGDTGKLLRSVGIRSIARLEDSAAIESQLRSFLKQLCHKSAFVVSKEDARRFSRESLTGDLNQVLLHALCNHNARPQ